MTYVSNPFQVLGVSDPPEVLEAHPDPSNGGPTIWLDPPCVHKGPLPAVLPDLIPTRENPNPLGIDEEKPLSFLHRLGMIFQRLYRNLEREKQ